MSSLRIVALETENVKRVQVVHIHPNGSLVTIGGKNSQGKSSVLDSIEYALGGGGRMPAEPLRRGQRKGRVKLDLGELVVERKINAKGSSLIVTSADGTELKSPQAILDALCGKIAFDPLEFARMKPREQASMLQQMTGLDLQAFEVEYKSLFEQRTGVNRRVKQLEGELAGLPAVPKAEPLSSAEVGSEIQAAVAHNSEVDRLAAHVAQRRAQLVRLSSTLGQELAELERLKTSIASLQAEVETLTAEVGDEVQALESQQRIAIEPLQEKLAGIDAHNAQVRAFEKRQQVADALLAAETEAEALSDKLKASTEKKAQAVADAKFPIDGLGFSEDGVLYQGLPFEQASTSQRIRVSTAIGLSLNPKLPVLLCREGSMLDEEGLAIMQEMAEAADAQIWLERVGTGAECSVIIEDGLVKEVRETAAAAEGGAS